ncbi:thiol reductant ABC exporter subunit CydD, partial [Mycobacterium tuberculosis]|nr:thiol reductant ABC exporter subunit CydD [Mycobacterium tuberculosis]
PIMLLVAAATQSWIATRILLLTAPLVPVFMVLIGHATARKSRQQFAAMAQLSGRFLDWLRGTATPQRLDAVGHASQA